MRNRFTKDNWLQILVIVLVTALSGIAPVPHLVKEAMLRIGQAKEEDDTASSADDLILVASRLPGQEKLYEEAGRQAFAAGNAALAIESFKKSAAVGSLSASGYLFWAEAYAGSGNLYTAAQVLEAETLIFGPSRDSLARLAQLQKVMEDFPGLIDTLKQQLDYQQTHRSPLLEIAETNYELGILLAVEDSASALPYLRRAVELNPTYRDAGILAFTIQRALTKDHPTYSLMAAGRELASQNKWDLAARAFQKAVDIQPDYAESWAFLGEAQQHLEERFADDALPALANALELKPESLVANILMALYWKRAGDLERQYQYLAKAAQIDPENPAILVDIGDASAILGDLETGYNYHLQAIELTYKDPAYLRALVRFCIRYNYNLREVALPVARQAVIADQGNPATLDMMGQLLFRLGDLLNAQRFYQRALTRDPEYAPAYLHLGQIYSLQGQSAQAAEAFSRAIALAPGSPTASLAERFFDTTPFP
jgi:tetratricopeptide (TPR) repeat protein